MAQPQQIAQVSDKQTMLAQFTQDLRLQEEAQTSCDIFRAMPPATESDIVSAVRTLTACFPNMQPDFWALLTNRFAVLKFSRERLQHILHIAVDTDRLINQYRFNRLTVADFTSITISLQFYSYNEAMSNPDLVWVFTDPTSSKAKITTRREAEISGYKWKEIQR